MRGLFIPAAVVAACFVTGCGGGGPPPGASVNPDDFVQQKLQAMEGIAELAAKGADEGSVIDALEKYRGIPFEPKKQPETAKKILDVYKTRVAPKVKGEAALQLKGDMNLLEYEMK